MENNIKKILNNFSIGVLVLIISYIMLYFIGGEYLYSLELNSLLNIKSLLIQTVLSGVLYIIFMQMIKCTSDFTSNKKENTYSDLFKYLEKFIGLLIVFCILSSIFEIPENVWSIYVFNLVMIMIFIVIISSIIQIKEVKKINKALKDRNKK